MEIIALLSFLTNKYREAGSEKEQKEISTLYWAVLATSLNGNNRIGLRIGDTLTSSVLN